MKVLSVNGYYLLPEDFEGTFEDALESFLEYRKSKGYTGNETGKSFDKYDKLIDDEFNNQQSRLWNVFIDLVEDGNKFAGLYGLTQMNPDGTQQDLLEG